MAPAISQALLTISWLMSRKNQIPVTLSPISIACQQLSIAFPNITSFPGSETYINETTYHWSRACVLAPYCVYEPSSAQDVAGGLKIIRETNTTFAVRSGGHMTVPGAANTNEGVLIAMTNIRTQQLAHDSSYVSLGPALTWGEVYDWLAPYERVVVGGRFAAVGIGGLLLGGGMSYFSQGLGWAANSVLNYEVVLANSSIVNANVTSNPDLFWALKGGSNNFGIVTRFDVKTYSVTEVFAGGRTYDHAHLDEYVHAIASYVAPGGGSEDPNSGILPTIQVGPEPGVISGPAFLFHQGLDPNPAALVNFTKTPSITNDARLRPTFSSFSDETIPYGDRSMRTLFWTTSLKGTPEAVYLMNQTFVTAALSRLHNIPGLFVAMSFQPLTISHLKAARASGGDAIDLDPADGPALLALIVSGWKDKEDDKEVKQFSVDTLNSLRERAEAANLSYPFTFLNDAGGDESVFPSYGKGRSLPKMRAISNAYDPTAVFQKLLSGGFKLWDTSDLDSKGSLEL